MRTRSLILKTIAVSTIGVAAFPAAASGAEVSAPDGQVSTPANAAMGSQELTMSGPCGGFLQPACDYVKHVSGFRPPKNEPTQFTDGRKYEQRYDFRHIKTCNESGFTAYIARGWAAGGSMNTAGWRRVGNGECTVPLRADYIFVHREDTFETTWTPDGSEGRVFQGCVITPGPFKLEPSPGDATTCSDQGGFMVGFPIVPVVAGNVFTWTLG
ncbi:DUF1036 domain-containing protein [Actinoplanes sp. NEAU-A12]|uniref:DUF1036 domain-containing protein n=1 Tax=Actinoplanes sandaracinus TaxID=3045177 RepID=A0ABT6WVB6_9ACTN|nr:DUF1036 domain-containing protein [Actinoplanes sandaracinus]MDI6103664.1 DUF1036 domain-containing protein [Actinoplanes sandaracinus]